MEKFKIGDTVKIIGQDVLLTVNGIANNHGINVIWFDKNNVLQMACIDREILVLCERSNL